MKLLANISFAIVGVAVCGRPGLNGHSTSQGTCMGADFIDECARNPRIPNTSSPLEFRFETFCPNNDKIVFYCGDGAVAYQENGEQLMTSSWEVEKSQISNQNGMIGLSCRAGQASETSVGQSVDDKDTLVTVAEFRQGSSRCCGGAAASIHESHGSGTLKKCMGTTLCFTCETPTPSPTPSPTQNPNVGNYKVQYKDEANPRSGEWARLGCDGKWDRSADGKVSDVVHIDDVTTQCDEIVEATFWVKYGTEGKYECLFERNDDGKHTLVGNHYGTRASVNDPWTFWGSVKYERRTVPDCSAHPYIGNYDVAYNGQNTYTHESASIGCDGVWARKCDDLSVCSSCVNTDVIHTDDVITKCRNSMEATLWVYYGSQGKFECLYQLDDGSLEGRHYGTLVNGEYTDWGGVKYTRTSVPDCR